MKKKILLVVLALSVLGFVSPKIIKAQSPIQCGLLNEHCCNLAGGTPNSCKTGVGLVCVNGVCISDGTNPNPPERGSVDTTTNAGADQPLNLEQIQTGAFPTGAYGVGTTIGKIISDILPYIFTITGILILISLIMGGFQLMFAAGDPKKVQGAWGKITNAIIGFVIIFIAYWLTQLIGKVFNIQIIKDIFK